MNLINEFTNWVYSVKTVDYLIEGKGHMDHPEDMVILGGLPGYMPLSQALATMDKAAQNPKNITIKFDGYPALVFGSGPDGKFTILDKHMFNRADRPKIYSPKEFAQYEAQRGEKGRSGLVDLIAKIWPGLEKSYQGGGFYMGDLLFSNTLQDDNGVYKFRPNPNGILYTVQVSSNIGQLLTNKVAGIAVHRYLAPDAINTENKVTWLSDLGNLKNDSNVALLPVSMPVTPNITLDKGLQGAAEGTKSSEGKIYDFINSAPQSSAPFANNFTVYLNSRIVSGNLQNLYTQFFPWIKQRLDRELANKKMSQAKHDQILSYLNENKNTVKELFTNWINVYNYKMDIVKQIDQAAKQSPIKGYLQSGQESQEGFVYGGLKFIDRMGFSAQNLGARQGVTERSDTIGTGKPVSAPAGGAKSSQQKPGKVVVIYPGGFHPFHPGHASVYNHLLKRFPGADVFVAATDTKTERPFGFDEKKFLANQSGIPANRFVQVKSPYSAEEITSYYKPQNTLVIFVMSMKDRDRVEKLTAPKADGSPSKFQLLTQGASNSMDKTYYIYLAPTTDFKLNGQVANSASAIRAAYIGASEPDRVKIIKQLYPLAQSPSQIKKILDRVLLDLNEADNPNYFGGSSLSPISGTPPDLIPGPDAEEIKAYQKQMRDLQRFMGHTKKDI